MLSRSLVVGRVFLEEFPATQDGKAKAKACDVAPGAVFVELLTKVPKCGEGGAQLIELLSGIEGGPILNGAAVASPQAKPALRQQSDFVILPAIVCVGEVFAIGNRQARIEIVIGAPKQVVTVPLVFLNAESGRFVRVVAQTLRAEADFVEPVSVAVARIYGKAAVQQANAIAVVDVTAIAATVAADCGEAVTKFPLLHDVVIAGVVTANRTGGFACGWRDGLLSTGKHRNEEKGKSHGQSHSHTHSHLRKKGSLLDP